MELLYTAHVPPGDGPHPTIVLLHGWGASAHDLLGLAPILHGGGALVLCPQGPVAFEIARGVLGFGWWPITQAREIDAREFDEARRLVRGFLDDAIKRYPVDRRKIVLAGFSQGGVMAYDLVLREPARFAGLAALSSWLPDPLARSMPPQPEHKGLPVFVCHGTEDPMIPVERARESREALLRLGVNLAYREYPMGHEIRPEALRDLVEWLQKAISPIQLA
jgi:phospholipase/carboxylesterase